MVQRIRDFLGGLFLGLLATGLLLLILTKPIGKPIELHPPPTPAPIRIHIDGAVHIPGVYSLPRNSIVLDAVEHAGGLLDEADLSDINLAAQLKDGQRILIKRSGPVLWVLAEPTETSPDTPAENTNLIHVNTASAAELERLPGIGPVLAKSIVEFRENNGQFTEIEDLLNVPGIGSAKLAAIRDLILVP
jgi:competence protein ComEA